MGIVKKLVILLLIYFIAGFVIFYLISTGTQIPVVGEIVELVFMPVGWTFNIVAPTLGLNPVDVPVSFIGP